MVVRRVLPLLHGVRGLTLGEDELDWLSQGNVPVGFILFARNIQSAEQTAELCAFLSRFTPEGGPPIIAFDQEGGRVQRVTFGGALPPARVFGEWYKEDPAEALEACELAAFLLAAQVRACGGTVVLAPVLDVAHPQTHQIIGDRAFSDSPQIVAALANAHLFGTYEGGCLPCLKHFPGHGLACSDSHAELPKVDVSREEILRDMEVYSSLVSKVPFVMTAHIRYPGLDGGEMPATYSEAILRGILRNQLGFKGVILADDLGMKALTGDYVARLEKALNAGCDVGISALSVLKHGMSGTVFDEENFSCLRAADNTIPELSHDAKAFVSGIVLPAKPDDLVVKDKMDKFQFLCRRRGLNF